MPDSLPTAGSTACGLSIPFNVQSSPPGASLYLVPMWDWQTHQDGARLLADVGALSTYLVTQGRTPLASIKLKAAGYMAVFELAGQRKNRQAGSRPERAA